ncbi:MAG: SNF2-related protein [Actinomycetota bacterium]
MNYLQELLADRVPIHIRDRGRAYFKQGAVSIAQADEDQVNAHVVGTRRYLVRLALRDETLFVSCSCPYFDSGVCKHIWATILASEAGGHLADVPGGAETSKGTPPPARTTVPRQWPADDEADWGDDLDEYDPMSASLHSAERWAMQLRSIANSQHSRPARPLAEEAEILYLVNAAATRSAGRLAVDVVRRERRRDGEWGKPKTQRINSKFISTVPEQGDRQILTMLLGAQDQRETAYDHYSGYGVSGVSLGVPGSISDLVVPLICDTGRGRLRLDSTGGEMPILKLDHGRPWEICIEAHLETGGLNYAIDGRLQRGDERMPLQQPAVLIAGGFVFGEDGVVGELDDGGAFGWISSIRAGGPLTVPSDQTDEFLAQLLKLPTLPRVDFPAGLQWKELAAAPRPRLQITSPSHGGWVRDPRLSGRLSFAYEQGHVSSDDPAKGVFLPGTKVYVPRDPEAENAAAATLAELGWRPKQGGGYQLAPSRLSKVVARLIEAGWHVEAEGVIYRSPGAWSTHVVSGIDWFELKASLEYGETTAGLPELLAAAKRGDGFVVLGDETMGLLPEKWLEQYGLLASLGTPDGQSLRFKPTQAGLLDALIAAQPQASVDKAFARARNRLRDFGGVAPVPAPPGFVGELRPYQKEGLGWFNFLDEFGFGGCLADDMGLGKTVQVLALLESRRAARESQAAGAAGLASLVVVPKSLVFNWIQEADRFAPKLKILDHTGQRLTPGEHFEEYDVVLTTYGILRRDAAHFSSLKFDYCILDEAQTIKNASTSAAKAARLLRADHRLALSGTPIENHLGELWSLFEFLNPGMLGAAGAFKMNANQTQDENTRLLLAKALRPFILRRTKDQVAKDLPPKTEQTLFCELKGAQRTHYDELRDHFRRDLLGRVDRNGMAKSKMLVLEALLRLRQAACHPGLIDHSKAGDPSAKLDLLIPQLVEVAEEGHKALVFSQFTKLLAIVRGRLDREGIVYEYLDGRTRNRRERVERFQGDPDCRVFLISLKAGGLGLNLTSAGYVFLLDPWWNPAVEAQAIDRTHRIGQTRPVFAYRIIAAGTVEEKVLQLQETKRALADSIINADNSLIRNMQREDLELLLS